MSDRDKWLTQCEGFGWDDQLGSGFQANSELCLACADSQPDRYAACVAEAKVGRKKVKKEIIMENENAEQEEVVADQEQVVEPVKEETPKPVEAEKKPKEHKVTIPEVMASIIRDSSSPLAAKEIDAKISEQTGDGGKSHSIGWMLSFGVALGTLKRENNKYSIA